MKAVIVSSILLAFVLSQGTPENMNGEYLISNPNPAKGAKYSTLYKDRTQNYFDVYSPPI